uniref:Laminin EGF-like domain-containing protein n=1 Tax=Chlamydomonas euryale TaxID=1486919 RepID=A0A7R9VL62_9CHLO|mmetsp:Transcript_38425/g.113995  ORF Transcript_38425/g.113995 Transcript_38425/m.113995 type:complete len:313 (+) Transcript_38425:563-1501(+)
MPGRQGGMERVLALACLLAAAVTHATATHAELSLLAMDASLAGLEAHVEPLASRRRLSQACPTTLEACEQAGESYCRHCSDISSPDRTAACLSCVCNGGAASKCKDCSSRTNYWGCANCIASSTSMFADISCSMCAISAPGFDDRCFTCVGRSSSMRMSGCVGCGGAGVPDACYECVQYGSTPAAQCTTATQRIPHPPSPPAPAPPPLPPAPPSCPATIEACEAAANTSQFAGLECSRCEGLSSPDRTAACLSCLCDGGDATKCKQCGDRNNYWGCGGCIASSKSMFADVRVGMGFSPDRASRNPGGVCFSV